MKTVIEIAREAGWPDSLVAPVIMAKLAEFAELVRADERARMAEQPAQRTWVGLTDEDVRQCSRDVVAGGKENSVDRFAYAIESKLKEKNT